jgi:hypothetical protein
MIRDHDIAKQLIDTLDDCSERINETIRLVKEKCSDEEFQSYRKAAGFVMGYIYTDVVASLYKEHPDLEPPELKSDAEDD